MSKRVVTVKRRGIRLKQLSADDPGLLDLLESDLCADDDEAEDPDEARAAQAEVPPLGDVVREVREGLEEALKLLEQAIAGSRRDDGTEQLTAGAVPGAPSADRMRRDDPQAAAGPRPKAGR